ncbi:putative plant lipid transfer protein/Par allergen [Rosa chinensis]|uniref:Putative plant lipid transfer protein/Par allergen n=2 Tax=Rosa chinensis TaxID=74649 RepID=A0A2P6SMX9_ROSCH|nr:putative plant lipid transfer protein/Par allergen [Rosa chinensis]
MGSQILMIGVLVMLLLSVTLVSSLTDIECSSVTALVSACYTYITYGSPDPSPGSPCCHSMVGLKMVSDPTVENRRFTCRCLMSLISTYNPNGYALATLPDLCEVSLGFNIDPNTDCNLIP